MTDNLNLAVTEWSPFGITTPTDPRLPLSGDPITMHTLNANKVGVATDNLRTFSDINTTVYDGLEFSANMRKDKLLLFGGVTTDRRATTTCDERDNPNSARFCDSTPPFRTTFKLSAAYQLPWDFQLSGSFIAHTGTERRRQLHGDGGHRRPPDHRHAPPARRRFGVNLIEPNTVFLDLQEPVRPAHRARTSASAAGACRASPTSSTC